MSFPVVMLNEKLYALFDLKGVILKIPQTNLVHFKLRNVARRLEFRDFLWFIVTYNVEH